MNGTRVRERLQLAGAVSGAAFAVLAFIAFLLAPGPSSSDGVTVVEYYATHASRTFWAAALVGLAAICLLWFAETFTRLISSAPFGVAGAAATAALYLAAVGCWEILGEIYGGVDVIDVPSAGYSNAHTLQVVGVGAAHMGNFAAAAFVGATTAAMLASTAYWRPLGLAGIAFTAARVISALIELASKSHWSDVVAIAGFLVFLAWVFIASAALVANMRRGSVRAPRTARHRRHAPSAETPVLAAPSEVTPFQESTPSETNPLVGCCTVEPYRQQTDRR
jgi:hypothetical protein